MQEAQTSNLFASLHAMRRRRVHLPDLGCVPRTRVRWRRGPHGPSLTPAAGRARDRAPDPRPVRRDPGVERDRPAARHPVPDRARARGDPARLPARRPRGRAPSRPGPGDLPAAAALRGGVLRGPANAARQRTCLVADLDRPRAGDHLLGRGRRPRADRPALGGRLRARRHRLADRPGRCDRDRPPARRPAPAGQPSRGREPAQRLLGADRLPGRRGGGDRRQLLAGRRHGRLRGRGCRRDRDRAAGRRGDRRGQAAARRHSRRDHDLDLQRIRGLPSSRAARRLGRARGSHHRDLPGLARASDLDRADADTGIRGLGADRVPAQRGSLHAHRPSAAEHPRRGLGHRRRHARRLRAGDHRSGRRDAIRCGCSRSRT